MKFTDLKPNILISFTTTKGVKGIAKVTDTDSNFNTILTHNAINANDFTPIKGRFGGLIINFNQVNKIITL